MNPGELSPTELLAFILEISALWFAVAGIGLFFFMRWRRRERKARANERREGRGENPDGTSPFA